MDSSQEFDTLCRWADEEIAALMAALPDEVGKVAAQIGVSLEDLPGNGLFDDELAGDELGVFEGPPLDEEENPAEPRRIRLFLGNIADWVGGDEQDVRDEIATTFLHELGHLLGWDEDDVERRGLG